jgi:site-specific recombinase XerD
MADELTTTGASVDLVEVIRGELGRSPHLASPNTRRVYLGALTKFEAWRAGRPVTKLLVEEYTAHLQETGAAARYINVKLAAIRWWVRRLADLEAENKTIDPETRREHVEQAARVATVGGVRGEGPQMGRHVSDGEIRALLTQCLAEGTSAGTRDAALLALAFATGMRRSEIAALALGDVAPLEGGGYELTIRHAKGDKTRKVTAYNGAAEYLGDWLALRGGDPGPLFLAMRRGGHILAHGVGTQALQKMLDARAAKAGVVNVHWHDARRTMAGNLLDRGADLATVQKIMGHSSPETTAAYDRRPEETRRKALRGLHVPYLKGGK